MRAAHRARRHGAHPEIFHSIPFLFFLFFLVRERENQLPRAFRNSCFRGLEVFSVLLVFFFFTSFLAQIEGAGSAEEIFDEGESAFNAAIAARSPEVVYFGRLP